MAGEEDKEKPEGEAPPSETLLDTGSQRDPEEATLAEQAIHSYAVEALGRFEESVQTALDAFSAWVQSQNDAQTMNDAGLNAQVGEAFLQQMLSACGGKDTPIGAALFDQLDSKIDEATRNEHESSFFVTELARSARDFTWYLRDNLQSVLSNEWDQLRDLAYEGSTDFIPALHAFGLPSMDWSAGDMQTSLVALADKARQGKPRTQEEAVEKDPRQEEEEQQQLLAEEEGKKQAM